MKPTPTKYKSGLGLIGQMLGQERLVIDRDIHGRTCFHSHFGACPRLGDGPWIAHRGWIEALSLRPLSASLQSILAQTAVHHHGRQFSVGRLELQSSSSGIPFGGSLLQMRLSNSSLRCVYGYALGKAAQAMVCDWLVLDLNSRWAHNLSSQPSLKPLHAQGIETLLALGARMLCLTRTVVEARQFSTTLPGSLTLTGHPRFSPYLDMHQSLAKAQLVLWPMDSLQSPILRKQPFDILFLMNPTEIEKQQAEKWAESLNVKEVVSIANPDHMDPNAFLKFWTACGEPIILLRGETQWLKPTEGWFRDQGIEVCSHNDGVQLGLFQ